MITVMYINSYRNTAGRIEGESYLVSDNEESPEISLHNSKSICWFNLTQLVLPNNFEKSGLQTGIYGFKLVQVK